MKKSLIKNISLGIACLLGVGGAITAGVLSTNSPSINNAEATTYGLHVGNIEVTSDNLTIDSSDTTEITSGSATYNPETKTLTLDNFHYQGAGYTGAWEAGVIDRRDNDLTILLKGNNSILKQNDNSMSYSHGIYFYGNKKSLTIDEEGEGGSLEISFWADRSGDKSNGIFLELGSFVMNGGTVVSNAGRGGESAGIYAHNNITFNGGSFTGRGYYTTEYASRGIYTHSDITINGGDVFGYAPLDNGDYAAYAYNYYKLGFKSGDLYAEGKTAFEGTYDVSYPSGTTILGGENEASATVQTNVKGGLHYYHLSFGHKHNWSYTADGASITAKCLKSGCSITTGLTLAIGAPSDLVYSGTAKTALLNSFSADAFGTPEISYYKENVLVSECVDVGTYEARVTVGGKTAIKEFTVAQATPTGYDIPEGLNATYGDSLSSVTLPNNWRWKNPSDKVGNAGNVEHVAIYSIDTNYKEVEETLTVAVGKANPSVPTLDTIEAPYDVALSTLGLPEGFSWMDGTQKTSTWGENTFKVKYTPADQANYNVMENIDVKVNVKWILVDPTQDDVNVTINGDTREFTVDITIKVEVKTEITVDEKRNEYASLATKDFVKPNEDISAIYGVKLIRTTNGVEEEIQPSDIKPGTKITVSMAIPEELVGKDFRLLHIHNSDDIVEVTNYAVSKDGKTLMLEVDRLSDFAFIIATDADNGFIYSIGLPGWALALIIIGGILLLGILALLILFIFFPVYYIDYSKHEVRRAIYLRTRHGEVLMLNTHLAKVRRNETDVYKKKGDALNALNK